MLYDAVSSTVYNIAIKTYTHVTGFLGITANISGEGNLGNY